MDNQYKINQKTAEWFYSCDSFSSFTEYPEISNSIVKKMSPCFPVEVTNSRIIGYSDSFFSLYRF